MACPTLPTRRQPVMCRPSVLPAPQGGHRTSLRSPSWPVARSPTPRSAPPWPGSGIWPSKPGHLHAHRRAAAVTSWPLRDGPHGPHTASDQASDAAAEDSDLAPSHLTASLDAGLRRYGYRSAGYHRGRYQQGPARNASPRRGPGERYAAAIPRNHRNNPYAMDRMFAPSPSQRGRVPLAVPHRTHRPAHHRGRPVGTGQGHHPAAGP